jgi:hypothetical protein
VIISDFFASPDDIVRTIEPLRYHGNEVVLFHVLDPQELRPQLNEPVLLVDMETQESLEVTPEYGHEEYRVKVQSHITQLQDRARSAGMDYHLLVTDRPLDAALRQYLTLRQRRH